LFLGDDAVKYFWIAVILALAAVGPNIFPAAQAGYSTLHVLASRLLLPSVLALIVISAAIWRSQRAISRAVLWGAVAGALATIPLEIVRLVGFHFDYMPGNLPRLMGVLLLDRFAEGPSTASDLAGWAYHFWNGASFGIIYAVLFGTRRRWLGAVYGLLIGIGFMVSPVVKSLGVGLFGLQFSYGFPLTVTLAHLAFGLALGFLARCFLAGQPSTLSNATFTACPCCIAFDKRAVATRRV
jgi:hypothetical protein